MKYRGSTSGAVMSESALVRRRIKRKEVVGPSSSTISDFLALTSFLALAAGAEAGDAGGGPATVR